MTATRMAAAAVVLATLVAAGCAGAPARPATEAAAIERNRDGLASLGRGDADGARAAFEDALRMEKSIEREAGIARNAYNLSVAYQRLGRLGDAERVLDEVLQDTLRAYPAELRAELALRRATLSLLRGSRAEAGALLRQARADCGARCPVLGPLLNLEARLALESGDAGTALSLLADAVSRNRRDPVEAANTDRLLAAGHLLRGDAASAHAAGLRALEADKRLARADRIQQDLVLLARSRRASPAEYRAYLLRAAEVARARGDADGLRDVQALLDATDVATAPSRSTP